MNLILRLRAATYGAIALGTCGTVGAGDFFPKVCDKSCDTKVTLPARQIDIVQESPRVVVREPAREVATRAVRRSTEVGVVPLSTVFLPISMPLMGVGGFGAAPAPTREIEVERDPLDAVREAEIAMLRSEQALDKLNDLQRAMQRSRDRSRALVKERDSESSSSSSVDKKLTEIQSELKNLNERVTAVEKLLIYHDNWIQKNAGTAIPAATSKTTTSTTTITTGGNTSTESSTPSSSAPQMIPPAPSPMK